MRHGAWLLSGVAGALLLLAAAAAPGHAHAQSRPTAEDTVRIELRVWQNIEDDRDIRVSARPADGSWQTLGAIPLPLDDGHSPSGRYRYGDITVAVPPLNRVTAVKIDIRVWQYVADGERIYISARPDGGSWATLGTIRLPLDEGIDSLLGLRYGATGIDVLLPEDEVSTLAGRAGVRGYADGPADRALFGRFAEDIGGLGVAFDRDGSVIVADRESEAIRRIAPDGTVTTIAGGNGQGVRDGPAETAQFAGPTDVAIADDGTIYVADSYGHRIRKIAPDGTVTTVAGGGPFYGPPYGEGAWGDFRDGPATQARFSFPHGIALDKNGDLFIAEDYRRIRRLSPSGIVSTYAGGPGLGHRDGPREEAEFLNLLAIEVDAEGNIYVIDNHFHSGIAIRKVDTTGVVSTLRRGGASFRRGTLASPRGLAVTGDGAIYIANTGRHQILELTPEGVLRALAGTGEEGYADGPRVAAMFNLPAAIDVTDDGRLVVADEGNNLIRTIAPATSSSRRDQALAVAGQLARLEGVKVTVFASGALLSYPTGMAQDLEGNVIVADSRRHAIRRISPRGIVTTIAGGRGEGLRDGLGRSAQFSRPEGVAVHADGSIYVADTGNNRIRRIAPDGEVTTVAGGGPPSAEGNWGDFRDGPAAESRFRTPRALAFDQAGNLLIVDNGNSRIRLLSPTGEVSTVAGASGIPQPHRNQGNSGSSDGPGNQAVFHSPDGIALDDEGNIFFTESNSAIRMIDGSGFVSAVLRTPHTRYGGALSPFLGGIALGSDDALYVTDFGYARVIRVTRDGEISIVADHGFQRPLGIIFTGDGDLLVSDTDGGVIWKITLGGAGSGSGNGEE